MLQNNLIIIFFLFIIVLIDAIDEDLFKHLWKNLKPPSPKNFKRQKFYENYMEKNEKCEQQNAIKIEMADKKPKLLQKIKNEQMQEENNNLNKIKVPKIELDQLSEKSFENEFDEQADQNVSSADQSNSADVEDYSNMNTEEINEIEILNEFNLMKKELRKESVYKTLTIYQFECEIAKKLGTSRWKIYKLKKKLGQKRERTEENEETKRELIRKYDQMRKEKIYGFKYDKKQKSKIENKLAKELGINLKKIYKWKSEMKKEIVIKKKFSMQQKIEKIKQFEKVKEELKKKFNLKTNWKINEKIAEKIGVRLNTIRDWKKKLNLITRKIKIHTDAEQLDYVKRGEEMRKRNPMMSKMKIAETLGIPSANLRRWTKKFGTKLNR